jgi:hypothetical protein
MKQDTIDEHGNIAQKFRMTLDQTFLGASALSVNFCMQDSRLPPILYSFTLS